VLPITPQDNDLSYYQLQKVTPTSLWERGYKFGELDRLTVLMPFSSGILPATFSADVAGFDVDQCFERTMTVYEQTAQGPPDRG
jgi:hypothetical protein